MSETPSLSVVERAGLVRLRSEAGDLALAGAGWGTKPTPSEAGVGGGSGGGPSWSPCQRQVHAHYLAPLAPGGRVEIG